MIKGKETKSIELKMLSIDEETGSFEGYASVFDIVDDNADVVIRGAFAKSLLSQIKVKLLYQHDYNQVIGIITELYEDSKGLYIKGQINLSTQCGREVYSLVKQGAIDSMSIGYVTQQSSYRADGVRVLEEVTLYEISIVSFPSNPEATISQVKSVSNITPHEALLDFYKNLNWSIKQ